MLKQEVIDKIEYIVDNCMGDSNPACIASCPMHTNVKEYVRLIGEGNGQESIKLIRESLFLPKTLGRICAHPCEANCKWNEGDNPISIAGLKRYAADNFDDPNDWDLNIKADNGHKVAIIGAGPAGAQAALDLRKEGFRVTIFDKLDLYGGMMGVGIPQNFPKPLSTQSTLIWKNLGLTLRWVLKSAKIFLLPSLKRTSTPLYLLLASMQEEWTNH